MEGSAALTGADFCRTALGWSYGQAVAAALGVSMCSGLWMQAWRGRLPPGVARLLVAAPVLGANLLLPRLFCRHTDAITLLIIAFNVTWLSNFKLLSWVLNRGALCMLDFTPTQFMAVYATPVTPVVPEGQAAAVAPPPSSNGSKASGASGALAGKGSSGGGGGSTQLGEQGDGSDGSGGGPAEGPPAEAAAAAAYPMRRVASQGRMAEDAGSWAHMAAKWGAKLALIVVSVAVLQRPMPGLLQSFAYGMALYALLAAIMDGPAALAIGLTGLRVSPHFDQPWRSTSVASFWSKRWDLAAGNSLRQLIYDCICEGRLIAAEVDASQPPAPPAPLRQSLGVAASFATSGAIHEAVFWYMTGHSSGGYWFFFFAGQFPLIVAERLVLTALRRRGVALPLLLRNAVTALLLVGSGQLLFWPPCAKHGVIDNLVGNAADFISQAAAAVCGGLL